MSRGEDAKKLFGKKFFFVFLFVCISLIIFLLIPQKNTEAFPQDSGNEGLPLSKLEIKYEGEEELSLWASVSREKLCEFAAERGVNLQRFTSVLPENLEIFCVCGIRKVGGKENVCVKIKKAEINGISIPSKLLSDIGEINLDFKRSLVYN